MRVAFLSFRSTSCFVAAIAFAALAAPASAQSAAASLPPAKELIAKFVSATNSPAVMAKHTSIRTTGRFEMPAAGMGGDLEIVQARPNKSLMRISLAGMGEIVRAFDGARGWSLNPMQGPQVLSGHELDAMREESEFGASSRQGPNVVSAETVERTEMNGEACYKVKFVWKSGRETFDCYSVASGLLVASVLKQDTAMGAIEVTNLINDYKEFGGQKVATRITQQAMGQQQVMTIQAVDYDVVEPSTFEMPPAIKALVEKAP